MPARRRAAATKSETPAEQPLAGQADLIRVFVADEQPLFRDGIRLTLEEADAGRPLRSGFRPAPAPGLSAPLVVPGERGLERP